MRPTRLALDFRAQVAPQPYCANVVCEGLDPLALPNKELIPKLQTKFFPLHTCQQLEIKFRVSRAVKRVRGRLALLLPYSHSAYA